MQRAGKTKPNHTATAAWRECRSALPSGLRGIHRDTILKLLVLAGERCQRLMADEKLVDLTCHEMWEVDEIWGYVGKKEGHKTALEESAAEIGDCYTFIAIERHTKLSVTTSESARRRPRSISSLSWPQLLLNSPTNSLQTDSRLTREPSSGNSSGRVHFAQLVKVYAASHDGEQRYSPPEVVKAVLFKVQGFPPGAQKSVPVMWNGRTCRDQDGNAKNDQTNEWVQQKMGEP